MKKIPTRTLVLIIVFGALIIFIPIIAILAADINTSDYAGDKSDFADVTSRYWAWTEIATLYSNGITSGCSTNPLRYCPEEPVTRAQMAIFLERGIHGANFDPPAVGGSTGFNDVSANHWAAKWIKQLALDGITNGCGNGNYCPEDSVTRAQMAIFLLRAKYGANYSPPAVGSDTSFGDVNIGYWADAWIKQLATVGITGGCGYGNYCPEDPVTRAQMAVFLVRTFALSYDINPGCNDRVLTNLDDPGNPPTTTRDQSPGPGFLQYDEQNFDVYHRTMHNRIITVAIEKGYWDDTPSERLDFVNFFTNTWGVYWKDFGGFPFVSYTLVVGHDLPYSDAGEFGPGWEDSFHLRPWNENGWGHGIFHAWSTNAFSQENGEGWITEGFADYYDARTGNPRLVSFPYKMRYLYRDYKIAVNAGADVPLSSLHDGVPNPYALHYRKGALVAYLMDVELSKNGHHVGEVLREIYNNYGIVEVGNPSDQEILDIVNRISGKDFTDFFNKYIFGTEPLPIDPNNFVYICHDNSVQNVPTQDPTPTPSWPITIDGYKDDWQGYPYVSDREGDSISNDTDLIGYSLIQDENFIDIMVETKDRTRKNEIKIIFDIGLEDINLTEARYSIMVEPINMVHGAFEGSSMFMAYPEIPFGWENVVEIQIPKTLFKGFEFQRLVNIYLQVNDNGNWIYVDQFGN